MSDLRLSTALASMGMLFAASAVYADDINADKLLNLSLEQLTNIEVTSVSKKSEKESEAAAAIYVITQDDIRHSGMTSIPELLRMVPGLNVAQSGAHQWAISSRGFNDEFANKLLVLIDGRTVYTPLFSGVNWDVQDTPLADIDRIEVIRGPGATLYGANAVNGVINIFTKNAKDTQGGYLSQSVGNAVNSLTSARYGTKMGENGFVRVYAKYDDYDSFKTVSDTHAGDAWNKGQAGFRGDWKKGETQTVTLQGDFYHAGESGIANLPQPSVTLLPTNIRELDSGGNVIGRWDNKFSKDSDLTLQMYYDDARRDNLIYNQNIQTFDLDAQHVWTAMEGHEIVWGAAYRLIKSDTQGDTYTQFSPDSRSDNLFSAFVQDKITLLPNSVFLTLGSKFEHNDYTGYEYEPSARLSWLVDDKQTLWSSVSRAVRTPNIASSDVQLVLAPAAPNTYLARLGDPSTESEELIAYELGYRIQPEKNMSLDVSTFYNDYSRLVLGTPGPTVIGASPVLGIPYGLLTVVPVNVGSAHSWGIETSAKWKPMSNLDLAAGYTLQQIKFDQADPYGFSFNGKSPQQQFSIRSTLRLPHDVEWNSALYYVDSLTGIDLNTSQGVDNYTRLDTNIVWHALDSLDLSLVGQNLLDNQHQEFSSFLYQNSSQVPRSVYGNVTVKF